MMNVLGRKHTNRLEATEKILAEIMTIRLFSCFPASLDTLVSNIYGKWLWTRWTLRVNPHVLVNSTSYTGSIIYRDLNTTSLWLVALFDLHIFMLEDILTVSINAAGGAVWHIR